MVLELMKELPFWNLNLEMQEKVFLPYVQILLLLRVCFSFSNAFFLYFYYIIKFLCFNISEFDSATPDKRSNKQVINDNPIKPHEQRALNFLVHEYLLTHSYKLTSITFSDENENQELEDWQDVGLNIPKPSGLLQIYREYMRANGHDKPPSVNISVQTEFENIEVESKENELKEMVCILYVQFIIFQFLNYYLIIDRANRTIKTANCIIRKRKDGSPALY